MKRLIRIAGLAGIAAIVVLVLRQGAGGILDLLAHAGPKLLWLVPLHALPLMLDVRAWRALLQAARVRLHTLPAGLLLRIALVREAVNRLLPVANVGGEIAGIRLLVAAGADGAAATASVIVEVMLTLVSQLLFAATGLACVLHLTGRIALTGDLVVALAAAVPLLAVLLLLLRYGAVFRRAERLFERVLGLSRSAGAGYGARLDDAVGAIYAHRGVMLSAVLWQLAGQLSGAIETWLALAWLGHPVSWAAAVALESLTQLLRNFVFIVPAGLGVQEAGLVGLGYLLGVGSEAAIALSAAKRMREILCGVPALIWWQWARGTGAALPQRR